MSKKRKFTVKELAYAGVSLALAFVLSYIRVFRMPTGGSVTLCSMLFVSLIGYFFGPVVGLTGAFVYAMLQFVQGPSFLSPLQFLFDYVLAFTALGLSGFFHKMKNGLLKGYIVSAFARFIFATMASLFFWSEYLPEGFGTPFIAAVVYNGSYIGAEALITCVILLIPPVAKAFAGLKESAIK